MTTSLSDPEPWVLDALRCGLVIPAHPLALTRERKLDERRQRALSRYYLDAGAGGLAVGVHTTQFAIRDPQHGLHRPVLELAAATAAEREAIHDRRFVLVAGLCGPTPQATHEAEIARDLGYHAGLLSLGGEALKSLSEEELIRHVEAVAEAMPIFGFYLQPAAGGRLLSYRFWRRFVEVPNVVAIKVAPFNRYQTLDVVRAVAKSGRAHNITLYTGNDDAIVTDLLTEYRLSGPSGMVSLGFAGGLLGHWACWTRRAVETLATCREARARGSIPAEQLTLAAQITDMNAALFDAANGFRGCIAGVHEILRRQGLLEGIWCLDPNETLSPGQAEALDRVTRAYPELTDDAFVRERLDAWLD